MALSSLRKKRGCRTTVFKLIKSGKEKSIFYIHEEQRSNHLTSEKIQFQLDIWGHFLMIKIAKPWNMLTMKTSISEAFQHRLNKHFLRMTLV